jgi:hypothetical protein
MSEGENKLLDGYWTEQELADQLQKNRRTVQRWRKERTGPPFTKLGNSLVYNSKSAREWLRSREMRAVRNPKRTRISPEAP